MTLIHAILLESHSRKYIPKMASQSSDRRVTITDDAPSDGSTQQQLETINISPQLSTMDGPGDPNEFRYGIII